MGLIESNTTNAQLHIALLKVLILLVIKLSMDSNKLKIYNSCESLCFSTFSSCIYVCLLPDKKPSGTEFLQGIPPVNKTLNDANAWITVLCKKLAPWWPWVRLY